MTRSVGTTCSIHQCRNPRCIEAGRYRFCRAHWKAEPERREINRLAKLAARPQWRAGRDTKEQHA